MQCGGKVKRKKDPWTCPSSHPASHLIPAASLSLPDHHLLSNSCIIQSEQREAAETAAVWQRRGAIKHRRPKEEVEGVWCVIATQTHADTHWFLGTRSFSREVKVWQEGGGIVWKFFLFLVFFGLNLHCILSRVYNIILDDFPLKMWHVFFKNSWPEILWVSERRVKYLHMFTNIELKLEERNQSQC